MIPPCAASASGTSEPTGSSGAISPSVIARPNSIEVTDLAIDQLSKRRWRLIGSARSPWTRQPSRYTRTANDSCVLP